MKVFDLPHTCITRIEVPRRPCFEIDVKTIRIAVKIIQIKANLFRPIGRSEYRVTRCTFDLRKARTKVALEIASQSSDFVAGSSCNLSGKINTPAGLSATTFEPVGDPGVFPVSTYGTDLRL